MGATVREWLWGNPTPSGGDDWGETTAPATPASVVWRLLSAGQARSSRHLHLHCDFSVRRFCHVL